jgi:hypothetical protein
MIQVRFDSITCVELDAMVHCGITDIRFRNVSFGVLQEFERRKTKRRQLGDTKKTDEIATSTTDLTENNSKVDSDDAKLSSMPGTLSRLSFSGFSGASSPARPRDSLLGTVTTLTKDPVRTDDTKGIILPNTYHCEFAIVFVKAFCYCIANLSGDLDIARKSSDENNDSALDQSFAGVGIWYTERNLAPCLDDAQEQRVIEDNYFQPPVTPPSVERRAMMNDNFQFAKEEVDIEPAMLTEKDEQYFCFDDEEEVPTKSTPTFVKASSNGLTEAGISEAGKGAAGLPPSPEPTETRLPQSRGSYKPSRKSFTPSSPASAAGPVAQGIPASPGRTSRGSFGSHMPPRKLMMDSVQLQNHPSTPKKNSSAPNFPLTPIPPNYVMDDQGLKPNGPIAARHSIGRATISFPASVQQTSTMVVRTPPGGNSSTSQTTNPTGASNDSEAIFSYTNGRSAPGVRQISLAGIEKEDLESLSRCYMGPISENYQHLVSKLAWLKRAAEKYSPEVIHEMNENFPSLIDGMNEETMNSLMMAESISATKAILLIALNISTLVKCSNLWKNMLAALPKCMPYLLRRMKKRYFKLITVFWKEQMMVHTCRATNMTKVHHAESEASLLLEKLLKLEIEKCSDGAIKSASRNLTSANHEFSPLDGRSSNASESPLYLAPDLTPPIELKSEHQGLQGNVSHVFLPARGLCLFDPNVHNVRILYICPQQIPRPSI